MGCQVSHLCCSLTSQKSSLFPPICKLPSLWGEKRNNVILKYFNCPLLLSKLHGAPNSSFCTAWGGQAWLRSTLLINPVPYFSCLRKPDMCMQCMLVSSIWASSLHFHLRLGIQKRNDNKSQVLLFSHKANSPRSAPGRFWPQHATLAVKLNCLILIISVLRDATNSCFTLR